MKFEKFERNYNVNNYDVFPCVFSAGKEVTVNIRPLGGRAQFTPGEEYDLTICALDTGTPRDYPSLASFRESRAVCLADGSFKVTAVFPTEQQYFLRFSKDGRKINQFSVYAVEGILDKVYPFVGDMHIHTTRSDGSQIPEVVCANYRSHGYDFMAVTDHDRYYPSLDAMNFYKDIPTELCLVPGEEVHMPDVEGGRNDVHIVNFGGEYSVNALVEDEHVAEVGKDLSRRAVRTENVPDVMTKKEFSDMVNALVKEAKPNLPEGIDAIPAVICKWVFDNIKNANGLGIFAHPTWISNVFQVPERFSDYLFETRPFDAFEVLGGESYFEQNGLQVAKYYEECARGNKVPIVGSTDSHNSYTENRNAFICKTMVFAKENTREAIIDAVKNYRSLAIDTISEEFRLVGERRLQKYACFLIGNYLPRHDELCMEEGRLMKICATGTPEERAEAEKLLGVMYGRVARLREKYFSF